MSLALAPGTVVRLSAARPRPARLAVAALFLLNGTLTATWVSRIPAFQARHGLGHAELGLALLALAFGAVVAMPLTGAWIARRGSAEPTRFSALLLCLALAGIAWAGPPALFVVALALTGAVHGCLDVAMNAQALEVERLTARPIMSSFHACFSAGGLLGAASGAGAAAFGLEPRLHLSLAAGLLLAGAWSVSPLLLADARPREEVRRPGKTFPKPSAALLGLGLLALCTMVTEGAMADWSALYLREVRQTSESVAAMGYAAFSIAMAVGRWGGDALIARFGRMRLLRWGGASAVVGLLTALLWPGAAPTLFGFAAVGLGLATLVPILFSAAGNLPGQPPGPALSAVTTCGYLGFLLGPPAIGFAAQSVGLRGALGLLVVTSALLVAGSYLLRLPDR